MCVYVLERERKLAIQIFLLMGHIIEGLEATHCMRKGETDAESHMKFP